METEKEKHDGAAAAMRRINRAWLDGHLEEMASMVHEHVVMAFPGFTGRAEGRENFLAGFRDFCRSARIDEFRESELGIDVVGDMAVVTFRYEMIYERSGERFRSTGRDFWVLKREDGAWIALWRTMLDADEKSV